ncbi:hypothetical protein FVER14953_07637 [Fusarium verticillioides]|nr:hypothetical protein FVER14953_07637 [Fusarium verticillioides]
MDRLQEILTDCMYEASADEPVIFPAWKTEPRLVSELKPVGVIDSDRNFIGVRFQNLIGDDVNVMAQCETVPNARIYQGVKKGFHLAVNASLSDGPHDGTCVISVPVLTQEFMANLPSDNFKVEMQLRVVEKQEDTEYNPVKLRKAGSESPERANIILPGNMELSSQELDPRFCIILEEVIVRCSSAEPSRLVRMKLT